MVNRWGTDGEQVVKQTNTGAADHQSHHCVSQAEQKDTSQSRMVQQAPCGKANRHSHQCVQEAEQKEGCS